MAENSGKDWLSQYVPEDVRLYVFLIFKVALLIFHHNHVTLSDYAEALKHLSETQECLYLIEMGLHLAIKFIVNGCLIWLIVLNVIALHKRGEPIKSMKSVDKTKNQPR